MLNQTFCTDSLEFLKPEDAQNVRKRLFEFTILTHSVNSNVFAHFAHHQD